MITYTVEVKDNGDTFWKLHRKLHRLDGPAVEFADGYKAWWINGRRHRLDGPAIEWFDGRKEWWVDDEDMTEEDFLLATQPVKEMTLHDVNKILGFKVKIIE